MTQKIKTGDRAARDWAEVVEDAMEAA